MFSSLTAFWQCLHLTSFSPLAFFLLLLPFRVLWLAFAPISASIWALALLASAWASGLEFSFFRHFSIIFRFPAEFEVIPFELLSRHLVPVFQSASCAHVAAAPPGALTLALISPFLFLGFQIVSYLQWPSQLHWSRPGVVEFYLLLFSQVLGFPDLLGRRVPNFRVFPLLHNTSVLDHHLFCLWWSHLSIFSRCCSLCTLDFTR